MAEILKEKKEILRNKINTLITPGMFFIFGIYYSSNYLQKLRIF